MLSTRNAERDQLKDEVETLKSHLRNAEEELESWERGKEREDRIRHGEGEGLSVEELQEVRSLHPSLLPLCGYLTNLPP